MPKVLVVDDDPSLLEILTEGLKGEGFEVIAASDGLQGLERMLTDSPDIVLLDVMMPGMDGFEVCRKLKEAPATSAIPIVFLTARASQEDIRNGLELGADDYLTKPFDLKEVSNRLRELLARGGRGISPPMRRPRET